MGGAASRRATSRHTAWRLMMMPSSRCAPSRLGLFSTGHLQNVSKTQGECRVQLVRAITSLGPEAIFRCPSIAFDRPGGLVAWPAVVWFSQWPSGRQTAQLLPPPPFDLFYREEFAVSVEPVGHLLPLPATVPGDRGVELTLRGRLDPGACTAESCSGSCAPDLEDGVQLSSTGQLVTWLVTSKRVQCFKCPHFRRLLPHTWQRWDA
jgi:hypothetical protein